MLSKTTPKVPPPPPREGPEKVWILAGVGDAQVAIGGNELELDNAVDTETIHGGEDGVTTGLKPATRDANRGRVTTDEGHAMAVGEAIDFIEDSTGAGGDGVVDRGRDVGGTASRDKGSIVLQLLQVARPQGERTLSAATAEVVVAGVLDHEWDAGGVAETESLNNILCIMHVDIVVGHVALGTGVIPDRGKIGGIVVIEQALVPRIGCAHFILIVHVSIRNSSPQLRRGVVVLDNRTFLGIARERTAIVAGETRQRQWLVLMQMTVNRGIPRPTTKRYWRRWQRMTPARERMLVS